MEHEMSQNNDYGQISDKVHAQSKNAERDHQIIIRKSRKNVLVIGLIFLLIGSAEYTMLYIQSSVHATGGMGVISSSVINIMTVVSSLFISTFSIKSIGIKGSLAISIIGYIFYIGTNAFGSWGTLIAGGAVQGLVQGPVWTSSSCYIRAVGLERAEITGEDPELVVTKLLSIFYFMYQLANIPSCLVASLILSSSYNNTGSSGSGSLICGKDFCPSDLLHENFTQANQIKPASQITIYILVGVCGAIAAAGIPLTYFALDVPITTRNHGDGSAEKTSLSEIKESFLAAIVLHKHLKMWLIMPIGLASGVLVTFIQAEWTEAFVSCTFGITYIGWGLLPYAITVSVCSYACEWLQGKTNRITVFSIGSSLTCGVLIYYLLWTPGDDQLWLFLLLSALWGIGESPWYPLGNALYGEAFPDQSDGAFANYNVYFGLGSAVAFAYSNYICTDVKIYIVLSTLIFTMASYVTYLLLYKSPIKNSCCPEDEAALLSSQDN